MSANSQISWTNHTFNPWIGCTKVSPACDNCYAAEWAARYAQDVTWGSPGTKSKLRRTSPGNWAQPAKWNRDAEKAGVSARVFCASLSDIFDADAPQEWRDDVWKIIEATPHLDWLLLTKRPQNVMERVPEAWREGFPPNVWMGTTAENQTEYDRRRPHLMAIPAIIHFYSMEPLLSHIALGDGQHADWYIVGGESGDGRRMVSTDAYEELRAQVKNRGAAFFFKQDGAHRPGKKGRVSDAMFNCKELP